MTRHPALHHVMTAIPLGGEELARSFYVGTLGLDEIAKPAALAARGGVWIATASLEVHLGVDPNFTPARKAHIALIVMDLDAIRERLKSAGTESGPIEYELPGYRRCYVDDPFGNRIELMQSL